jgi:2-polyprenyl-6-methoxyphenol hydroxylase-like FAD-dependent oxidoreductase
MRIAILGAGPAGLYLAYLLRRAGIGSDIQVFEQNPPDATFGFGVVFSDRALEFLQDDDPETFAAITPAFEAWQDITLNHKGQTIRIDGIGFTAVGRLHLLHMLQDRLRSVGIEPTYNHVIGDVSELDGFDLVVGADGVNSLIRRAFERDFGTTQSFLSNRFNWFGTTKPFETLSQTFVAHRLGTFNVHHYRYAPAMSTFLVEVDEKTFFNAGFDRMPEDEVRATCEEVYAEILDGHNLMSNKSHWRQFPKIWNQHWSHGKYVLLGDALRTAHFSIGSGSRLAMEDAIALLDALRAHPNAIPEALAAYEAERRPIVEKLVRAANTSADWYENFPEHMKLDPWDFAMSYITRSGRIDRERLRRQSPRFVADYEAAKGS